LERLAEDSPRLRETVLDVMCAYLRSAEITDDDIVRTAAQNMLLDHLAFKSRFNYHKTYWPIAMITLSGAVLDRFGFMAGKVDTAHFARCVFKGGAQFLEACIRGANFTGARFEGPVSFAGSKLEKAIFVDAQFQADADFGSVYFGQEIDFSNAIFALPPSFVGAHVRANAASEAVLPPGWRISDPVKSKYSKADEDAASWCLIEKAS
jgi:pentapeptide repeat protein